MTQHSQHSKSNLTAKLTAKESEVTAVLRLVLLKVDS